MFRRINLTLLYNTQKSRSHNDLYMSFSFVFLKTFKTQKVLKDMRFVLVKKKRTKRSRKNSNSDKHFVKHFFYMLRNFHFFKNLHTQKIPIEQRKQHSKAGLYLQPFGLNPSDQQHFGPTTLLTNNPSDQRPFGPTTLQTNNPSEHAPFGPTITSPPDHTLPGKI